MYLIYYPEGQEEADLYELHPAQLSASKLTVTLTKPGTPESNSVEVPLSVLGPEPNTSCWNWLVSVDGPYNGGELVEEAEYAFRSRQIAMLRAAKAKREEVKNGGCTTTFGVVDTNLESRLNINGLVTMASILGTNFAVEFTRADNTEVPLDATQMTTLGLEVGQFAVACHNRKKALEVELNAATTEASLDLIDINSGWPT